MIVAKQEMYLSIQSIGWKVSIMMQHTVQDIKSTLCCVIDERKERKNLHFETFFLFIQFNQSFKSLSEWSKFVHRFSFIEIERNEWLPIVVLLLICLARPRPRGFNPISRISKFCINPSLAARSLTHRTKARPKTRVGYLVKRTRKSLNVMLMFINGFSFVVNQDSLLPAKSYMHNNSLIFHSFIQNDQNVHL